MKMATFSCACGKVILSCENNRYRVRMEDGDGDTVGDSEFVEFIAFNDAQEQFIADTEQILILLGEDNFVGN